MYIDILINPQVYSTHISCATYFVYEFKHVKSHMSLSVPVPTLKLFLYTHTHKVTRIYISHHTYMSI